MIIFKYSHEFLVFFYCSRLKTNYILTPLLGILLIFPYQDDTNKERRDQEKFIEDQKTDWLVESTIESKIVSE
jgi:hypothetical protein